MSERPRLVDGPHDAPLVLALAHGAGAPMDSPFLAAVAHGVAAAGFGVVRFEFPYMAARRAPGGRRRPPDRQDVLCRVWREVAADLGPDRLVVGGKSMGGRIASMIADQAGVRGLVCLGYPFHPPGRADRLRTAHLAELVTPTLVVQGERDPFGTREEVAGYHLSPAIELVWLPDGDHSFKPRRSSGHTAAEHLERAISAVTAFLHRLAA